MQFSVRVEPPILLGELEKEKQSPGNFKFRGHQDAALRMSSLLARRR